MNNKDKPKPRKRDGFKAFFKGPSSPPPGTASSSVSALATSVLPQDNKQGVQTYATSVLLPATQSASVIHSITGSSIGDGLASSNVPSLSTQPADDNENHL